MRRPAILCSLLLVVAGFIGVPAHAVTLASTTRLANSLVPNLSAATLVGHLPATQKLQVTVALDHPDAAGEAALQKAVYDKSSPLFHHFLTPAVYAARFGASTSDLQRVTSWLTRNGMTVAYTAPSRTQVVVQGTAAQAEKTFATTLNSYALNGHTFRANTTAALVPTGVGAIQGLQTASSYVLSNKPANDFCLEGECIGLYTPQDLWKVYDLPGTDRGAGMRAAVLGEGSTVNVVGGLRKFEAHYGLPQTPVHTVYVASDHLSVDGDGEWEIDSQAITGMAPDLEQLTFYMSQDLPSVSNSIAAWVNDPTGPSIANMSIGGCEALNVALGTPVVEQPLLRQGALEGRTLFVSTGDTGGSCLFSPLVNTNGVENTGVPNPQWPSTSDAVVGVGGTVLYTNDDTGERDLEMTWTHGGGGTSSFIPAPSWQQDIPLIKAPCTTDYALQPVVGYVPCRGVPDVSALSGDILSNGYTTYDQTGATFPGGGTSLASPLWAGVWARVQAASLAPLGLATPVLYAQPLDSFTDISVGTNVQWQAQPRTPVNPTGWDFTNGLGVPVGTALLQHIDGSASAVPVGTNDPTLPLSDSTDVGVPTGAGFTTCVADGSYADATGDGFFPFVAAPSEQDLTSASIHTVGANAVFTAKVVNLKGNGEAQAFEFNFTLGGSTYDAEVERGIDGSTSMAVVDFTAVTGTVYQPAGMAVTFDDASNTVTLTVPSAAFKAATGKTLAGPITGVTIYADADAGAGGDLDTVDQYVPLDDLDATSCTTTL